MIDVKDLRVGNYIECDGEIIQVDLGFFSLMWDYDRDFEFYYNIHPIPVSEDMLLKFPEWFADKIRNGYYNYSNGNDTQSVDVEYLHTAQNLYYCLTKKELKIQF